MDYESIPTVKAVPAASDIIPGQTPGASTFRTTVTGIRTFLDSFYPSRIVNEVISGVWRFANTVYIESAAPNLTFRETDQSAPNGRFRILVNNGTFNVQRALTGEFSTIQNSFTVSADGNIHIGNRIIQEDWIIPSTSGSGSTLRYYKDKQGRVHLQGRVTHNSGNIGVTLLAGYRPQDNLAFPIISGVTAMRCSITGSGQMLVEAPAGAIGSNTTFNFDGISFRAA